MRYAECCPDRKYFCKGFCKPCYEQVRFRPPLTADQTLAKRNKTLFRAYGITVEDYTVLLKSQRGRCAICRDYATGGKRLHVDHCHKSGRVRGLLCAICNWYLGKLDKNADMLLRLSMYGLTKSDLDDRTSYNNKSSNKE